MRMNASLKRSARTAEAITTDQQEFYELPFSERGNLPTRLVQRARDAMMSVRRDAGITRSMQALQLQWMGDLTDKRVLDLGCAAGNALSLPMAEACGSYTGIDLSDNAIKRLADKLNARGIVNAEARCVDFLSPAFADERFDVVYASSVMHHFADFDHFLRALRDHILPGGKVVAYEPLNTWLPERIARATVRPFESDSEWEHPFGKNMIEQIQRHFQIEHIQGVMGSAKLGLILATVPFCGSLARRAAVRLHRSDLRSANRIGRPLWRCMQVAICLGRLEDAT